MGHTAYSEVYFDLRANRQLDGKQLTTSKPDEAGTASVTTPPTTRLKDPSRSKRPQLPPLPRWTTHPLQFD